MGEPNFGKDLLPAPKRKTGNPQAAAPVTYGVLQPAGNQASLAANEAAIARYDLQFRFGSVDMREMGLAPDQALNFLRVVRMRLFAEVDRGLGRQRDIAKRGSESGTDFAVASLSELAAAPNMYEAAGELLDGRPPREVLSEIFFGLSAPEVDIWDPAIHQLELADAALKRGSLIEAEHHLRAAGSAASKAHQSITRYVEGGIKGAERIEFGLQVAKTAGSIAANSVFGPYGGALSSGAQDFAQQASEHWWADTRTTFDWAAIGFDVVFNLITAGLGTQLGAAKKAADAGSKQWLAKLATKIDIKEQLLKLLIKNPEFASLEKKALAHIAAFVVSGRVNALLLTALHTVFQNLRGAEDSSLEELLSRLVQQFHPRNFVGDVLWGAVGHAAAAGVANERARRSQAKLGKAPPAQKDVSPERETPSSSAASAASAPPALAALPIPGPQPTRRAAPPTKPLPWKPPPQRGRTIIGPPSNLPAHVIERINQAGANRSFQERPPEAASPQLRSRIPLANTAPVTNAASVSDSSPKVSRPGGEPAPPAQSHRESVKEVIGEEDGIPLEITYPKPMGNGLPIDVSVDAPLGARETTPGAESETTSPEVSQRPAPLQEFGKPEAEPAPAEVAPKQTAERAPTASERPKAGESAAQEPMQLDHASAKARVRDLRRELKKKRYAKAVPSECKTAMQQELAFLDKILRGRHLEPMRPGENMEAFHKRVLEQRPDESLPEYSKRLAMMDASVAAEADRLEQQGLKGDDLYWRFLGARGYAAAQTTKYANAREAYAQVAQDAVAARDAFRVLAEDRRRAGLGMVDKEGGIEQWVEKEGKARKATEAEMEKSKNLARIDNPARPGDFGEYMARREVEDRGLAKNPRSIQNNSGQGLDLVGDMPEKNGKRRYLFAEVKEEGSKLSKHQKNPEWYIRSRLEASDQIDAKRILAELDSGQAEIGRMLLIRVTNISKTTGQCEIKLLDWNRGQGGRMIGMATMPSRTTDQPARRGERYP